VSTQLERYSDYKVASLAPSYQTHFKRYIRIAKEFYNTKDIRELRKLDIIKYQTYLQENFKLGNKTIRNILEVFKAFLNYLKNDLELIIIVPKFPDIDVQIKPIRWFSQEDQANFFELVPTEFKDIIGFLILHGCRPSEARALRCKDVHLQDIHNSTITISATFSGTVYRPKRKGKSSRPVVIPIHPESYAHIAYTVKNNLPDASIFTNPHTGHYFGVNSLQKRVNPFFS